MTVASITPAIRRPVQRRLFAGTGPEEWRIRAARLSRRARWRLYWANTRGRAAPAPLAPLAVNRAVNRGEVVVAVIDRTTRRPGRIRTRR